MTCLKYKIKISIEKYKMKSSRYDKNKYKVKYSDIQPCRKLKEV